MKIEDGGCHGEADGGEIGGGGCRGGWKERRKIRVRVSCVRWRR